MLASTSSAVLTGVDATPVVVECDLANGLPGFTVVGLPDASVQEARERVRSAITHSGEAFPMCRITVNLAPSDVRKHGPWLDLAVGLALLVASEKGPQSGLSGRMFIGELGLSGEVRPVRGAFACAEAARSEGLKEVICPASNAPEAALAGLPVYPVTTLVEALEIVRGGRAEICATDLSEALAVGGHSAVDLNHIRDQDRAKRALVIAAAGDHNLLLSGPPGSGKTLLARALPGILPPLTLTEALEVTRIHSAAGLLASGEALVTERPFRSPHHAISPAGMVGGGSGWIRPGEVTLAHRGVLFLDEFPEFPRFCLEALRQPLEDGIITIIRARHAVRYPAQLMLVAAMNPCPCGNLGSDKLCRCTPHSRESYSRRLSGPLLDRIDLHVDVPRVSAEVLLHDAGDRISPSIRGTVGAARAMGSERGFRSNSEITGHNVLSVCLATPDAETALARGADRFRLSARSVHRVLRVARTIADLEQSDKVGRDHVLEALTYRGQVQLEEAS